VTIHPQRGGRYWYYWIVIVGGIAFVVAWFVSDGFGLGA
jgi:hypothetical protein